MAPRLLRDPEFQFYKEGVGKIVQRTVPEYLFIAVGCSELAPQGAGKPNVSHYVQRYPLGKPLPTLTRKRGVAISTYQWSQLFPCGKNPCPSPFLSTPRMRALLNEHGHISLQVVWQDSADLQSPNGGLYGAAVPFVAACTGKAVVMDMSACATLQDVSPRRSDLHPAPG